MRGALGGGLALIAVALAATLSRSPLVVASTNSVPFTEVIGATSGPGTACQGGEVVPRGTTAVRLWLQSNIKPRVRIALEEGSRTVASGSQQGGFVGKVTTVAIARVPQTLRGARLCFWIDRSAQTVELLGSPVSHPAAGEAQGKVRVEYMRPGPSTWWSLAGSVAYRLGLGRAPSGDLVFLIPLTLMALALGIAVASVARWVGRDALAPRSRGIVPPIAGGQTSVPPPPPARAPLPRAPHSADRGTRSAAVRGLRAARRGLRAVPAAAWACACVAVLSAASWSILTPPFQAPDEPSHFAYTQILAQTGELPSSNGSAYSPEEMAVLADLDHQPVRFNQAVETISTAAQERRLEADMKAPLSRAGRDAGVATSEPPLYYALQTIPYELGSGGTLLGRLALMRLLSALMAGATALFVFLFLREALPRAAWAWTVGGLCTALAPLLGFISGIVNPDALLCAISAALLFCLARGFRRGLTRPLAVAIGVAITMGLATKLNFLGLMPGVALALALLARRAAPSAGRAAYGWAALALAIGVGPICVYAAAAALADPAALDAVSKGAAGSGAPKGSPLDELSYIWQFYLPRLPGMREYFPGISMLRRTWFDKSVGMYGWLDTYFPNWVYDIALVFAAAIAALCLRELLRARGAVRARAGELLAYGVMGVGMLVLFGANSYLESALYAGGFSEPRYLLPLAALFAAVLALAARGAGRRWGPATGALLVMLILAHDVFSQLLVVGRFYG